MSTDMTSNVLLLVLFTITGVFGKCPANENDGREFAISLTPSLALLACLLACPYFFVRYVH